MARPVCIPCTLSPAPIWAVLIFLQYLNFNRTYVLTDYLSLIIDRLLYQRWLIYAKRCECTYRWIKNYYPVGGGSESNHKPIIYRFRKYDANWSITFGVMVRTDRSARAHIHTVSCYDPLRCGDNTTILRCVVWSCCKLSYILNTYPLEETIMTGPLLNPQTQTI